VLLQLLPRVFDLRDNITEDLTSGQQAVETGFAIGFAVALAILLFVVTRAAIMIGHAFPDLFSERVVEGRVLRFRVREKAWDHLAVDDGSSLRTRAFLLRPTVVGARAGSDVRLKTTPRLGYVKSIETLRESTTPVVDDDEEIRSALGEQFARLTSPASGLSGIGRFGALLGTLRAAGQMVQAVQAHETNALRPMTGVDTGWVSTVVGRQLTDVTETQLATAVPITAFGGPAQVAVLSSGDGDHDRVVLARWLEATAYQRAKGFLPASLYRPVADVGEEASWVGGEVLAARRADKAVVVAVATRDDTPEAKLRAASTLANWLLS
jgi:hypothetical protein